MALHRWKDIKAKKAHIKLSEAFVVKEQPKKGMTRRDLFKKGLKSLVPGGKFMTAVDAIKDPKFSHKMAEFQKDYMDDFDLKSAGAIGFPDGSIIIHDPNLSPQDPYVASTWMWSPKDPTWTHNNNIWDGDDPSDAHELNPIEYIWHKATGTSGKSWVEAATGIKKWLDVIKQADEFSGGELGKSFKKGLEGDKDDEKKEERMMPKLSEAFVIREQPIDLDKEMGPTAKMSFMLQPPHELDRSGKVQVHRWDDDPGPMPSSPKQSATFPDVNAVIDKIPSPRVAGQVRQMWGKLGRGQAILVDLGEKDPTRSVKVVDRIGS